MLIVKELKVVSRFKKNNSRCVRSYNISSFKVYNSLDIRLKLTILNTKTNKSNIIDFDDLNIENKSILGVEYNDSYGICVYVITDLYLSLLDHIKSITLINYKLNMGRWFRSIATTYFTIMFNDNFSIVQLYNGFLPIDESISIFSNKYDSILLDRLVIDFVKGRRSLNSDFYIELEGTGEIYKVEFCDDFNKFISKAMMLRK